MIVTREYINHYDINSFANVIELNRTGEFDWMQEIESENSTIITNQKKGMVIYIGDEKTGDIVKQWGKYYKWTIHCYDTPRNFTLDKKNLPDVIVIDGPTIRTSDIKSIKRWCKEGISVIFSGIPPIKILREDTTFRELLGIRSIVSDAQEITGIKLFGEFLLGEEIHYIATNKEEEKKQDMQMDPPWFLLKSGAKTYMVGMLEDEKIKNEDIPAIIWRYATQDSAVFVVNGDYMEDVTGIGLLSAMIYELQSYVIYPVINAQNLTIANFPMLASENKEEMMRIYSRGQREVFRDIIWPGLVSVVDNCQLKLTCMLGSELDDQDENKPKIDELEYYLKLMKEQNGELGISLNRITDTPFSKVLIDTNQLLENKYVYEHTALYVNHTDVEKEGSLNSLEVKLKEYVLTKNVQTVTTDLNWTGNVISFLSDNITLQAPTIDGASHTYREDFRIRSIETALAYSNILLDAKRVAWPETEEERWEHMFDDFSRYSDTYWAKFRVFDSTTLTESDKRVRDFLCVDYDDYREGDCITLDIKNFNDNAWFIFRTHGEEILSIEGGEDINIEKGAYLIQAQEARVKIQVDRTSKPYYTR